MPMNDMFDTLDAKNASINGIKILVGNWDDHNIPNVVYVSINMSHTTGDTIRSILGYVVDLELRILCIDRYGYLNNMGASDAWFMGTPEAITMFSLKYRKRIEASMDQKTMNKAMGILEEILSQEPEYRLNYQSNLRRLATGHMVILESLNYICQDELGMGRRTIIQKSVKL